MSAEQKFVCKECGKEFKAITNTHLKTHNLNIIEYKNKYPNEKLSDTSWFNDWRKSKENKENVKRMNKLVHSNTDINKKRINSIKETWSNDNIRQKHSKKMKQVIKDNPEKFEHIFNNIVTERMKLSNYERWVIDFGEEIANKKLLQWKNKNILPSKSKNTKIEITCMNLLEALNIKFIHQYNKIGKYYCDFYLPEYNLIIEVDGDYWHANPELYKKDDLIGGKKKLAEEIWKSDKDKSNFIKSSGYNLYRIFGSKIKTLTKEQFFEDIVQASKKLEG